MKIGLPSPFLVQANRVRHYLEKESQLPFEDFEERFFLISKAVSELDEMLWYILEDAKASGGIVKVSDVDKAKAQIQPEIERVQSIAYPDGIDQLIQIGTVKAKLNTILRLAVTDRR